MIEKEIQEVMKRTKGSPRFSQMATLSKEDFLKHYVYYVGENGELRPLPQYVIDLAIKGQWSVNHYTLSRLIRITPKDFEEMRLRNKSKKNKKQ